VIAPRGLWTFGVIETLDGLAAIGVRRGGETCWFAWHDTTVEQKRPARIAIATRTRGERWIDDVRMFVYDIHRELDRGPWLRYVHGPAPFDDASIGTSLVVGSDAKCELRILDMRLSRRHCTFGLGDRLDWLVEDASSTSGTFHNGQHVRAATVLRDRDRVRIGGTELEVMFDFRPRPRDRDSWRDDSRWRALFLETQLFPSCVPRGDPVSAAADALFARLGGLRAGEVEWRRDAFRAIDARWVFATPDEAEVFFDATLERGTPGFEPEIAPIVGDACARTGRGAAHAQLIRVGRVVAQLWNQGEFHGWTLDDIAARVVTRIEVAGF
jgi:hypothetical protein